MPATGVALSGATAATFRNGESGSGERLWLHYVSLYRSAPRGVHCSYWNQARVCAFLSSSTLWSSSSSSLPSSSSRYVCIYIERARYAHRPSNRGATRVKSTPSPSTRRYADARVIRYGVQLNRRRTRVLGYGNSNRLVILIEQNELRISATVAQPIATRMFADCKRYSAW